jgi:ribosomal protein L32
MAQESKAKRYRDRKAGKLPPLPVCQTCGCTIRNGDHLPLCQRCWLKTPDGLAYIRAKTARSRAKNLPQDQIPIKSSPDNFSCMISAFT